MKSHSSSCCVIVIFVMRLQLIILGSERVEEV